MSRLPGLPEWRKVFIKMYLKVFIVKVFVFLQRLQQLLFVVFGFGQVSR